MSTLFKDTHPEVEKVLIELLRQAPAWRKVEMVAQLNTTVRTMMLSGLRSRHPGDPPEVIQQRMADLLLGPELAARVYSPLVT